MSAPRPAKHYSLLLMRDDGNVRRLRVSPLALRLLVTTLFIVPALAVLGIWAAATFWKGNTALVDANRDLTREIKEMRVELERLSNLEILLEREDPVRLHALVAPRKTPAPTASAPGESASPLSAHGDGATATPDATSSDAPAGDAPPGLTTDQPDDATAGTPSDASETAAVAPLFQDAPASAPKRDISPINNGQARVDDVQVQISPQGKIRVTFSLSNGDTSRQLAGHVVFVAIDGKGTGHDLAIPAEAADFRISRFKKIVASARLPQGLSSGDIALVAIEIRSGDTIVFRDAFPFRRN
ncbi:hypothetical protein [Nitratidesulfovibrio vulgaris]|uniref:hypothetical protein n=1 Tax=Nitratidesulfovibrio vulgaris TaxID=881 RepID=UPI0023003C0B|nr:hypothetical protein [Nitratidesulfovibrio vulgaris]WCB46321.1 hypothetical protein PH214_14955 [Nitratidesulfovibrio vulgaris]